MGRFTKNLKKTKKMASILELEYELTNKSDNKGNVTHENFLKVMKKLGHVDVITEEDLRQIYHNNLNDDKKLHV